MREAGGRPPEFSAQALANSLWALASLSGNQHSHKAFIQAWVREAAGRLSEFNPQNLSNSLWALAHLSEITRVAPPPAGSRLDHCGYRPQPSV